ncbi:MAG: peptidylprolyl isomerase [Planctomycetota bacterium]
MNRLSQASRVAQVAALVLLCVGCGEGGPQYAGPALPYTPEPPKVKQPNPIVALITSEGRIELELFEDDTPDTVYNFISLIEKKFYDGTKFHRLVKDFMIQGGDPQGTGNGGPGYRFPDEINPATNRLNKYSLAMANSGPNTNGSQFFIMTGSAPRPDLERLHTVFGKVIGGMDVVDRLNLKPVVGETPKEEIKLVAAEVITKRKHKYEPWNTMPNFTATQIGPKTGTRTIPIIPRPPAKLDEKKPAGTKAESQPLPPTTVSPPPPKLPDTKAESQPAPAEKKSADTKTEPPPVPAEKKTEEKKAEDKKAEEKK